MGIVRVEWAAPSSHYTGAGKAVHVRRLRHGWRRAGRSPVCSRPVRRTAASSKLAQQVSFSVRHRPTHGDVEERCIVHRPADDRDWPGIWSVLEPSIRDGDWFTIPNDFTEWQTRAFWCGGEHYVFVGDSDGVIVSTYYICPIQLGGGSHVANAGYAVAQSSFGQGLGDAMVRHSLASARTYRFRAMQYAAVLTTNERAIRLYRRNGFDIIGSVPEGFRHPSSGYIDTLILHRKL